jgi:hypothetical protein
MDVFEIMPYQVCEGQFTAPANLPQSGNARRHAGAVLGPNGKRPAHPIRTQIFNGERPGTNQAHVTHQDVD